MTVLLVGLATTLSGAQAQAVATFGPAVRATPNGCVTDRVTMDARGYNRGFVLCYDPATTAYRLNYVQGWSSGHWQRTDVGAARQLMAVTDDGQVTYALYMGRSGAVWLAKRTRAGQTTTQRLAAATDDPDAGSPESGALTAVHGKWWAVWTYPVGGACLCYRLWQAKTMGTPQAAHDTGLNGRDPALVATSDDSVEMVRIPDSHDYGGHLAYSWSRDTGWGPDHQLSGVTGASRRPAIMRSGTTTDLAWVENYGTSSYVGFAEYRDGSWHARRFGTVGYAHDPGYDARAPELAYSDGHLFLGWTSVAQDKLVGHVAVRYAGSWSERTVRDGTVSSPYEGCQLTSLAATGGQARVVLQHLADWNGYAVQRTQW